jgi:hypothetical protein
MNINWRSGTSNKKRRKEKESEGRAMFKQVSPVLQHGWKDSGKGGWKSIYYRRGEACTHLLFTHSLVVIQKPYL